nr:branched-chain amino acid ABC transporter permease [Dehalococcoidales bacterium]
MNRRGVALGAVLIVLGAIVPLFVSTPSVVDLAVLSGYYLLLAGSWNLLAGFTGQLSFAHAGLAAVGGYVAVAVTAGLKLPVALSLPVAGLAAAIIGLGLGFVSLRVRGTQLSLITFGFAGALTVWLAGASSLTGGTSGHSAGLLFGGIDRRPYAWLALALVALYFILQSVILASRWGLWLVAVRDNQPVAEGLGVRTLVVQVVVFSYTAFWAGLAGSLYAGYEGIVAPSIANLGEMALILAMVVVGGMGRRLGPVAGVLVLQLIAYEVRGSAAQYTLLITSVITLAVVFFAKDGLVGAAESALRPWRKRRTRWQDVPDNP